MLGLNTIPVCLSGSAPRAMGSTGSSVQPSGDYVHYDFTLRHSDGIGILDV